MLTEKFLSKEADGWRPFSALPCEETMKNYSSSPRLNNHSASHSTDRNSRKRFWFSALGLRFSLRDYGFCMATLLLFCLGSLFYQLNGGPPKVLLEIRQYLGKIRSPSSRFPQCLETCTDCCLFTASKCPTFPLCVAEADVEFVWGFCAFSWLGVFGQVCFFASSPLLKRKRVWSQTCLSCEAFGGYLHSKSSFKETVYLNHLKLTLTNLLQTCGTTMGCLADSLSHHSL